LSHRPSHKPGARRHRGRPQARAQREGRRGGATQARLLAARVLERVDRTRAYADLALHHALARSELAGADRALATELVYGTLRWRGRVDWLLSRALERRSLEQVEPVVLAALRLGAYQIAFCDRVPDTAAVDQAVHCARALGAGRATGLVNAVLRRVALNVSSWEPPALDDDPLAHLEQALSLPRWIAERWLGLLGPEETAALARTSNEPPRLTVRANRVRATPEGLRDELAGRFPEAQTCRFAEDGVVLGRRGNAGRDPAFLEGRCTVQDEGSQAVVALLDPQLGERVLDTCAAPGTKTTAIAERVGEHGAVLALDRHPRRLGLVARDARRLGLGCIRTQERDATRPLADLAGKVGAPEAGDDDGGAFDRVLVDAPCSGLGVLRRNPDARWRLRPGDPASLAETQRALLERAAEVLRPGGRLVYSTCTLLPEENERVVEAVLAGRSDLRRVGPERLPPRLAPLLDEAGDLRCWPHRHDTDGFYAACLERTA